MFTFDAFEAVCSSFILTESRPKAISSFQRFAHPDVAQTLLAYLARYKEFSSLEEMKRVVNLIHRQAVRAKAEGLFFKVSRLLGERH